MNTFPFTVDVLVKRWIDGDTVDCVANYDLDVWPGESFRFSRFLTVRLAIVDTPERGQPGYREATEFCNLVLPAGTLTRAALYENLWGGRVLGDVMLSPASSTTISSSLLKSGFAVVWK